MWGLKDFAGVVLWCRTVFLKLFAIDRAISKILIVNSDSLLGGKYRAVVFIHSTTVLTETVPPSLITGRH